jgi:GntR family transcriptional regulator
MNLAPPPPSLTPRYAQIQRAMELGIATGRWGPDELLPSETELARQYAVSRLTVRAALRDLVAAGLLTRARGRGSFVTVPPPPAPANLTSFHAACLAAGSQPRAEVVQTRRPATPAEAALLTLPADAPLLVIQRRRFCDELPCAVQTCLLPADLAAPLFALDLRRRSLQVALEAHCGLVIAAIQQTLTAGRAAPELAAPLELEPGAPLLVETRRVTFHGGGSAWTQTHYHPERGVRSLSRVITPEVD